MIKLFTKDECAPDAKTLRDFQIDSAIGLNRDYSQPVITVAYQDWKTVYFVDERGRHLKEEYSCGVYEDFYQFDDVHEYEDDIKTCLLEHCDMSFLRSVPLTNPK